MTESPRYHLLRYRQLGDALIATGRASPADLIELCMRGMAVVAALEEGRIERDCIDVAYLDSVRRAIQTCRLATGQRYEDEGGAEQRVWN